MARQSYYIVNGITLYRLVAAPVLLLLIFIREIEVFKWMLALSFFTDAIDGYLARKFNVVSERGARLDSIADDATVATALIGLFVFKPEFIRQEYLSLISLFILYLIQISCALIRYRKLTSFHTYLAKLAALLQGTFLILAFFLPDPVYPLFYAAVTVTALDLIEETILVLLLPKWEDNVKGIYWILKRGKVKV